MGRKIFVSYKFADDSVQNLKSYENSTVRDYVTKFQEELDDSDHIYKGEGEDEDLSGLKDETIWGKLKDRIYDSSITVVFISPNMKEENVQERDQWIPWEVSYSLKETSRKNKNGDPVTSKTNAMVAVVLPDSNGLYTYYLEKKACCTSGCMTHHTNQLFKIIKKNKFNYKNGNKRNCDSGDVVWSGECSYIKAVKWCDFIKDYDKYLNAAVERQDDLDSYEIEKEVN